MDSDDRRIILDQMCRLAVQIADPEAIPRYPSNDHIPRAVAMEMVSALALALIADSLDTAFSRGDALRVTSGQ